MKFKAISHVISKFINLYRKKLIYKIIDELIDRYSLYNYVMTRFYFKGCIFHNRINNENIDNALHAARSRFDDDTIYYVTDKYMDWANGRDVTLISISDIKSFNKNDNAAKIFICAYESDELLIQALNLILTLDNAYYYTPQQYYPTSRYFHRNDIAREVLMQESKINLPKFEAADFENIIQVIDITKTIPGDYVEIGVYQGRSAHMALNYMNKIGLNRTSYFLDVFAGFTYDAATNSPDALWMDSHADTSEETVCNFLKEYKNCHILKSNIICDELPKSMSEIAVCNIDVDMYEAVLAALNKVARLIAPGGIIIVEDQGHTPALAGGYLALTEFMNGNNSRQFIPIHMSSGQALLIRKY